MKQLNGQIVVQMSLVCALECTLEQADEVIAAPNQAEYDRRLLQLICSLHPVDIFIGSHFKDGFAEAVGVALMEKRERELKMLASPAQPEVVQ